MKNEKKKMLARYSIVEIYVLPELVTTKIVLFALSSIKLKGEDD